MAAEQRGIVRALGGALSTLQRMIGYNAGLPQGTIIDPVMKQTGIIPIRGEAPSEYQATGTTVRIRGFERHPVVQACVRAIVDIGGAVPLQCYRKGQQFDDGRDNIIVMQPEFAGQKIVDVPSTFFNRQRFIKTTQTHYLLYGNAYWYLERPYAPSDPSKLGPPPTSLRIIHPEDVLTVWVNGKGYPVWYLWRDVLGYLHTSPVTDIAHFRDISAKRFVFGYPRGASALNDIIGDDEASQHVRQVVTNAGMPPAFALANEDATEEQITAAEAKLYEKWVSRGERGRFAIFGGIKDVKSVGFNLEQLEFPDLRRVAREDICAAFGVDPRMVGITSASRDAGLSGTQYVEARRRLIMQTIEPLMRDFEAELDHWLAPEYGDVYYRFDPQSLQQLVEDDDATSTRVQNEVKSQLRTIEEGRVALGQPREFDPNDTLLLTTGATLVPTAVALAGPPQLDENGNPIAPAPKPATGGGAAPATPPSSTAAATPSPKTEDKGVDLTSTQGQDPNDKSRKPDLADGSQEPAKKRAVTEPRPTVHIKTTHLVLARAIVLSKELRAMLWQQFDARATSEEAAYRRQALILMSEERANVSRVFDRQIEAAKGRSNGTRDGATDDTPEIKTAQRQLKLMYKSGGDVEQRWRDRFHPLIGETFAKGASHVAEALRENRAGAPPKKPNAPANDPSTFSYDFHVHDPNVQAAIVARASRLAGHVGKTTGQIISDAISIGLRDGMSIREIAELVDRAAFGASAGSRAMMIARTETIGALNEGQFFAAQDSGVIEGKEWLTQNDDAVRDSHEACEGEGIIPMLDVFETGMAYPGDPAGDAEDIINCRCTLLYYDSVPSDRSTVRYNDNHDPKTGQFATGDGGGGSSDGKGGSGPKKAVHTPSYDGPNKSALVEHKALATKATKAATIAKEVGQGFTLHDDLSADGAKGYFVSVAGHEQQIDASKFSQRSLLQYRDDKLDLLRKDDSLRIGGWHNPDDGRVYLDLSKRFETKEAAIAFGKKGRQIAGYDSHKGETFQISERSARMNSPLGLSSEREQQRLAAMHENPIACATLRTAPTLDDAEKIIAADAEGDGGTEKHSALPMTTRTGARAFAVKRTVNKEGELTNVVVTELK